jgi:hypothetical protein
MKGRDGTGELASLISALLIGLGCASGPAQVEPSPSSRQTRINENPMREELSQYQAESEVLPQGICDDHGLQVSEGENAIRHGSENLCRSRSAAW